MSDSLTEAIDAALQRSAPLDEFVAILRHFRDGGTTADSAYAALESLRASAGATEDRILEIMDIVSGFCAPHLRVWGK
jgi:hypothetical protein